MKINIFMIGYNNFSQSEEDATNFLREEGNKEGLTHKINITTAATGQTIIN